MLVLGSGLAAGLHTRSGCSTVRVSVSGGVRVRVTSGLVLGSPALPPTYALTLPHTDALTLPLTLPRTDALTHLRVESVAAIALRGPFGVVAHMGS